METKKCAAADRPSQETICKVQHFLQDVDSKNSNAANSMFSEYAMQFLKIRLESDDFREKEDFLSDTGGSIENLTKNRYRDVLPYDFNRVKLRPYGSCTSDYINASFVNDLKGNRSYIATQGPLDYTVEAFWSMVVQCNVRTIVMLCELIEDGKAKCSKYWPVLKEKRSFSNFKVSLVEESRLNIHYTVRRLMIRQENEKREIKQFHFHQWPDHSTPEEIEPLLDFLRLVREHQPYTCTDPIVVHCSAGCGRTGTFCALDMARSLLNSEMPSDFSVYGLVSDLRKQRPAMVQTREQFILLHQSIYILFRHFLDELGFPKEPSAVQSTEEKANDDDEQLSAKEREMENSESAEASSKQVLKANSDDRGQCFEHSPPASFDQPTKRDNAQVSPLSKSDEVKHYVASAITLGGPLTNA